MPRYVYRGSRGVRAIPLKARKADKKGCTCAPAFLFSAGVRGTEIAHFNPFRYVTVPRVSQDTLHVLHRRKYPAAGAFHDCTDLSSASNPFQHFQYISPHGVRTSFANHSIHRQQRRRTVPRAFFLVLINTEECTAIVETDRDFADRNPPPHSSPKHPEPFAILIGDGPLRGYQRLRALRRRGTRKARKAVCRPSPRPIGRPRFYFAL